MSDAAPSGPQRPATTIGANIRRRRLDRDWKLRSLAGRAGITVTYLSDVERDRTVPSLPVLQRIGAALGVSARELLRDVDPYDRP